MVDNTDPRALMVMLRCPGVMTYVTKGARVKSTPWEPQNLSLYEIQVIRHSAFVENGFPVVKALSWVTIANHGAAALQHLPHQLFVISAGPKGIVVVCKAAN